MKSCVLLPAAARRTQLFILLFSEPGVCRFADPCISWQLWPSLWKSLQGRRAFRLLCHKNVTLTEWPITASPKSDTFKKVLHRVKKVQPSCSESHFERGRWRQCRRRDGVSDAVTIFLRHSSLLSSRSDGGALFRKMGAVRSLYGSSFQACFSLHIYAWLSPINCLK